METKVQQPLANKVYHIQKTIDGWEGRLQNADKPSITGKNRTEVVRETIKFAKSRNIKAQIIIHDADHQAGLY